MGKEQSLTESQLSMPYCSFLQCWSALGTVKPLRRVPTLCVVILILHEEGSRKTSLMKAKDRHKSVSVSTTRSPLVTGFTQLCRRELGLAYQIDNVQTSKIQTRL